MLKQICALRVWTLLGLAGLGLATMGQQCAPNAPMVPQAGGGTTVVHVELVNQTPDTIDPGLLVNGTEFPVDPPIAPGEMAKIDFDCTGGTTLQTGGTQLAPLGPIPSDNTPLVQDDSEFQCGDTITFIFVNNGVDVFFTRVEVNGQFITD